MSTMNISAAKSAQTTNVSVKHKWLAKGSRYAKKAILTATVMSAMAAISDRCS